jgi:hypothetical protein
MRHVTPHGCDGGRIELRTIGRNAFDRQVPGLQNGLKTAEKGNTAKVTRAERGLSAILWQFERAEK